MEFEKDGKKLNLLNEYLFPKIFGESGCENETLHLINTFRCYAIKKAIS
ncbi:MAG: hypothetical protein FWH54_06855 [Methanobrevibacter sp.]|nr:hypothetical protein [Methanobrevibacter sp.]MCL2157723.1 hypothetical protein [Methanobrevibacter sp.]